MFNFVKPTEFCAIHSEKVCIFPKQLTEKLRTQDFLVLDYLYRNFDRQFKGAILNEEDGFNMQLQVSAFLNGMFKQAKEKFLVLLLCPDDLILNWHYHLSLDADLQVHIVSPKTCPEDFDLKHGLVLLLPFTNIKLAEALVEYKFFSIVIDHIDEVATKLVIRKLHGDFNIGLSRRNFFAKPQQKLQWTLLNWSNPGCVGKLNEFYQNDNDNFANLRDNYHHWWFTLTWKYSKHFQPFSDDEIENYTEILSKWAVDNNISPTKNRVKRRCYKKPKPKDDMIELNSQNIRNPIKNEHEMENKNANEKVEDPCSSDSSSDTIIYETIGSEPQEDKILNDVEPINENSILLSIIDDGADLTPVENMDPEIQISRKKEELMTQIFDDDPCIYENQLQSEQADADSTDFLLSLV
ncbi:uncharacterized protein isoform X2 [Leptinotarsa decemlineata]|uniref:uncharacterized protein isoform X2 n=1 Tax=Leptinotarsa decemlineata TaxID=7539 RepID=UPI003D30A7F7